MLQDEGEGVRGPACVFRSPSTYIGLVAGHEHRKVGEVAAGAGGVRAVGVQQPAALGRPLARHGALRVVPERTVGTVVVFQLDKKRKKGRKGGKWGEVKKKAS